MREGAQRILATFCYLPVRCQLLLVRARARGGGGGPTATLPFPSQRYASRGGTRRFFAHCSTERIRPASGTRGRRWGAWQVVPTPTCWGICVGLDFTLAVASFSTACWEWNSTVAG